MSLKKIKYILLNIKKQIISRFHLTNYLKIREISIIGRLLEHSRIRYFQNAGKEKFYISSADLIENNLDKQMVVILAHW